MEEEHFPKQSLTLRVPNRQEKDKTLLMWEEIRTSGKHPPRRSYHSAVIWNDKMIVYGGEDMNIGPQGGVWSIEIGQFGQGNWELLDIEDKGNFSRHSAILKDSKMYIFGGTTGSEEFNRTLILDLATLVWEEITPVDNIPPPLDSHTANLYQSLSASQMIVFGGFAKGERTNEVYSLDLETLTWSQLCTSGMSPEIRSSHSAVIFQDSLYILGGISDEGEKLNDFWRLGLKDLKWEQVKSHGETPSGRSGHSAVLYRDLMIVFGGMKDITKETNDMYSFDFSRNFWTLFQYEQQIKDPVSPDQLEEFKKTKANLANAKSKINNTEPSPSRMSPSRRPTIFESNKSSPSRRGTVEGETPRHLRRRRTLYEGPMNPTEGRIRGRLPHPRDGHSAVVNENIMIIFGGDRHQMPFNDTYIYYLVEENITTPVSAI